MMDNKGITILDPTMGPNEIRIIKSHSEVLGFNITNETDQHLFIEPVWNNQKDYPVLERIIIRK